MAAEGCITELRPHPWQNRRFTACATLCLLHAGPAERYSIWGSPHTHTVLDHYISSNLLDHEEGCIQSSAVKMYHPWGTINEENSMTNVGTWEAEWMAGQTENHLISEQWACLIFWSNKDSIPLLCPLIYRSAILPSVSRGDTLWFSLPSLHPCLSPSHTACRQLTLSASAALTLCMYLWQQWWELSRDAWLIQPCRFHTPLPATIFVLLKPHCIHRQRGLAGGSSSVARAHEPRVQHVCLPSPFQSTSCRVIYQQINPWSAF